MRIVLVALLIAVNALLSSASAQVYLRPPEDGFWWNPAESGRGWNFETENDLVAVVHYTYDTAGRSVFLTSVGQWNPSNRTLTTTLNAFEGGQCIGCGYVAPRSSDLGTVRFEFLNETVGRVIYPNGTVVPIERFRFFWPTPQELAKGVWNVLWIGSSGLIFGAFPYLDATSVSGNTVGHLLYGGGRPVVVGPSTALPGLTLGVVDATTSFYDYYIFVLGANKWSGFACTRLKTDPPPASLSQCTGLLSAGREYGLRGAQILFGPSAIPEEVAKSANDLAERARTLEVSSPITKRQGRMTEAELVADPSVDLSKDLLSLRAILERR